jgi:hypothetical protein
MMRKRPTSKTCASMTSPLRLEAAVAIAHEPQIKGRDRKLGVLMETSAPSAVGDHLQAASAVAGVPNG